MVYRPQGKHQQHTNPAQERSVVFIKQEDSSNKIAYSLPPTCVTPPTWKNPPTTAKLNDRPEVTTASHRSKYSMRGNAFASRADNVPGTSHSVAVKRELGVDVTTTAASSQSGTASSSFRRHKKSRGRGFGKGRGCYSGRDRDQMNNSGKGSGVFKFKQ